MEVLIFILAAFLLGNSSSAPRLQPYIYHQIFSLCDQQAINEVTYSDCLPSCCILTKAEICKGDLER